MAAPTSGDVLSPNTLAPPREVEKAVEKPFCFMDLPLDIRRLIYPLMIENDKLDWRYQTCEHHPSIMDISTTVRAEAFQAYVQCTTFDLESVAELVRVERKFLDSVNACIAEYQLDFDFLASVRVPRVTFLQITNKSGLVVKAHAHGLELIPLCRQLRKLAVEIGHSDCKSRF